MTLDPRTLLRQLYDVAVASGDAQADYAAGQLALREGALLERAARALATLPDVLLGSAPR